jgi:DNA end-binding protein Ku
LPEKDEEQLEEQGGGARTFWSGTITFGLVSVPVELIPANRPRRVSLRMLAPDGTPLRREYWSPGGEEAVETKETIHAYELEDGRFVEVTDEELEELAPRKTREIDLRLFVDRDELDPVFFERAYFLAPSKGATKPYRLLVAAMESADKAGIATFVMREREYLVAIIAENGILRAETMRFADEIRSAEDAGLPKPSKVEKKDVKRFARALDDRFAGELDPDELEDRRSRAIEKLVRSKLAAGKDVVTPAVERASSGAGAAGDRAVIDLMEELRRRMKSGGAPAAEAPSGARGSRVPPDLESRSKQELYELAKDLDIEGRSRMTKGDLIRAIRRSA